MAYPEFEETWKMRLFMGIEFWFYWVLLALLAVRPWILFFDYKYSDVLAAKPWQIVIAPKSFENNWFLRKRQTLGTGSYIIRWLIVPLMMLRLGMGVFELIGLDFSVLPMSMEQVEVVSLMVLYVVVMCFIAVLWIQYPDCELKDHHFIRDELKLLAIWGVITTSVSIPAEISFGFGDLHLSWLHVKSQVIISGFMCLTIVYPQRKCHQTLNEWNERLMRVRKRPSVVEMRMDIQKHWQQSISHKRGYEDFATFLAQQFSLENLLFVTEFVQLKGVIMNNEQIGGRIPKTTEMGFDLNLPPELPLSAIAEGFEDSIKKAKAEEEAKDVYFASMKELYLKYIDEDVAPLEINIGSRLRCKFKTMFAAERDHTECKDVMSLMESAAGDIVRLMTEAAIRYCHLTGTISPRRYSTSANSP